jgi:hypothetical protein
MTDDRYRWRTNPAVIARYVMGYEVPSGLEVTLKPNEACVVIEDGRVAGVATQQHMEVNPEVGLLGRLFGKNAPDRSFFFVLLGPHDLLFPLTFTMDDGEQVTGLISMRVAFTRESVARILHLPARGTAVLTASNLAGLLLPEVQAQAQPLFATSTTEDLRAGVGRQAALDRLGAALRGTLDHHGLRMQSSFVTWKEGEAQELLRMRRDLEHLAERNAILEEQQQVEMDAVLGRRVRELEFNARLSSADASAEAKAEASAEIARIQATASVDRARWDEVSSLQASQHDERRTQELSEAQHQVKMARLEALRHIELGAAERADRADKMAFAQDQFEKVQAAKRERIRLEAEREQQRLHGINEGSSRTIDVLARIAENSDDPAVAMEALRQLAELRKADVDAAKGAYGQDTPDE